MFTLTLPTGPTAAQILLPPPHLRAGDAAALRTYERLSQPVQISDPSTIDALSGQPAEFANYALCLQSASMKKKKPIFVHELLPMTQTIELEGDIPVPIWDDHVAVSNDANCRWHSVFQHYRGIRTASYEALIGEFDPDWPELPLFGITRNSIRSIVELAVVINAHESQAKGKSKPKGYGLLIHSVAIICLQYYLIQRNRFFEVSARPNEPFYESRPPYLFLFLPRYDVKKDVYSIPSSELVSNLPKVAKKYDYISFLVAVLRHISVRITAKHPRFVLTDQAIKGWCQSKMFNNTAQFFITSGFVYMRVRDFPSRIVDSIVQSQKYTRRTFESAAGSLARRQLVCQSTCKFFTAPDNYSLITLELPGKPPLNNTPTQPDVNSNGVAEHMRLQAVVPVLYCHSHFSCYKPAFELPVVVSAKKDLKWQDRVLYRLASYIDTTLLKDSVTCLNAAYRSTRVERPLKRRRLEEEEEEPEEEAGGKTRPSFHEVIPVDEVRVKYSYTVAYVAELAHEVKVHIHRDPNAPIHAETCALFFSEPCWKHWMEKEYNPMVHEPLRANGPLLSSDQYAVCGQKEKYAMLHWPLTLTGRLPSRPYYLRLDLQVELHSAEYEAICHYTVFRNFQSVRPLTHLWVVFYALVCLLKSEADAAVSLRFLYMMKQSDPSLLLSALKTDYLVQFQQVKSLFEQRFCKDVKVNELFHAAQKKWRLSRGYDAAIPSEPEWKEAISSRQYMQWLKPFAEQWSFSTLKPLLRLFCDHWTSLSTEPITLPAEFASVEIQLVATGETVSLSQFAQRAFLFLHARFCILGLCWRMLIPPDMIPSAPEPPPMHQLQHIKRELPSTFKVIRTMVKAASSSRFHAEVTEYLNKQKPVTPIIRSAMNSIRYMSNILHELYASSSRNSEVLDLLTTLSRNEDGLMDNVDHPKNQLLKECIHHFNALLPMFGANAMDGQVLETAKRLSVLFEPEEVPRRIVEVLQRVDLRCRPIVATYRTQCVESVNRVKALPVERRSAQESGRLAMARAFLEGEKPERPSLPPPPVFRPLPSLPLPPVARQVRSTRIEAERAIRSAREQEASLHQLKRAQAKSSKKRKAEQEKEVKEGKKREEKEEKAILLQQDQATETFLALDSETRRQAVLAFAKLAPHSQAALSYRAGQQQEEEEIEWI